MKIIVFCTANDAYIPNCVVSLLSVKRYNPTFDLSIISTNPSEKHIELCKKLNIKLLNIDLKRHFYKEWKYPKECYYHFKGPKIFHSMGYDYSVYIDGDMYCNNVIDINFSEISYIGGVSYGTCYRLLHALDGIENIEKKFEIDDIKKFNRKNVQTGFLIYNNKKLTDFGFFTKVTILYDLSIKHKMPRKGDDSLMALTLGHYNDIHLTYLPKKYNFILSTEGPYFTGQSKLITDCIVLHLAKRKPWDVHKKFPNYTYKYFDNLWRDLMIDNFDQADIKTFFPQFYVNNPIQTKDVCFYWYQEKTKNFGDVITPYILKNCNIKPKSTNPLKNNVVLLGTGSIMRLCGKNTIVWGSAIRDIKQDISGGIIRSVRGPLTRKRLIEIKCECPPIYGDPALLLPKLYHPKIEKKYKLGILPHFTQYKKVYSLYSNISGVLVIDPRTHVVEKVINQILSCKKIASSSSYGIIISHAYSVPVIWIKFGKLFGDDTKYYDHYMSLNINTNNICLNANNYKKIPVDDIINNIKPVEIKFDINRLLLASFIDFEKKEIKKSVRFKITKQKI